MCPGTNIQFNATHTLDPTAVLTWDFGDGSNATGPNVTHAYGPNTAAQTYVVSLTVTDSTDTCMVAYNVNVLFAPDIILFNGQTNLCFSNLGCGDSLSVPYTLASPTGNINTMGPFTWNFNDGSPPVTTTLPTLTHTFLNYGSHQLTVTAQGSTCPSVVEPILFQVLPDRPNIDTLGSFFCEGDLVNIPITHNQCPDNGEFYLIFWDFQNDPTLVDTFYTPGLQSFVYTLTDAEACAATQTTFTREIRVYAVNDCFEWNDPQNTSWKATAINLLLAPHPQFDFCPGPCSIFGCPLGAGGPLCWPDDSLVCFSNQSCPDFFFSPLSYQWDFGDPTSGANNASTLTSPSHVFTGPGIYNVSLTATNTDCGSRTITVPVELIERPQAQFDVFPDSGCAPLAVTIINNSTPVGQLQYNWIIQPPGSGYQYVNGTDSTSETPEIIFNQPGVCIIELEVSNACGSSSFIDTVNVFDRPQASIDLIPDTCSYFGWNPSVNLILNGLPLDSVAWDFGPNANPPASNQLNPGTVFFTPNASNTQTIYFYAENFCGPFTDSLTFNHFDRINLSGGQDTTLCLGDTAYCLIPNIGGGFWTFNGMADSAFCFDPILPDTFEVYYQIDSFACTFFDTVRIIVSDPPIVDAGPDQSVCPDDTLFLSPATGGGVWSGPWLVGDSLIVADSAGVYTLYYCFSDTSSNCGNCDSLELTVFPRHMVEAGPDQTFCLANVDEALPTPIPTGGTWSGAGVTNPTLGLFNPSLVGLGTHTVYYTDTNANGCVGRDSLLVNVIPITPADAGEDTMLCRNGALFPLSGTGDWSSTAPGFIAPSAFDPTVASGSFALIYTLFAGTSCEDSDTLQITVVDTALVEAGPNLDVCIDTSSFNLTGAIPPAGIWSGNGIIDPVTGLFDPSLVPVNQAVSISYTFTDPTTDCQSVDIRTITVRPLPAVNAGSDTLYCLVPAPQLLPTASPANGFWSGPGLLNANTGLIDPLAIGINVVNFVYTFQDGFNCTNTDTVQVTIASPDSASVGFNDTSICVNDLTFALSSFTPAGGDWFGAGFVAPNSYDPAQAGVGVDTLVYCVGSNTCRTCDTTLINVQAIPVVNAGNYVNVCQFSDSVLLNQGTPAAGVWTGPQVVQVGPDFYFLPLVTGISNLTYTYTDPLTDCSNSASTTIEVDTLPLVLIAGDSTYCLTPLDQALPAVNLGPGQWSGPGLINATSGIFNPSTTGTGSFPFIYEFIDGNGCSDRDTVIITVIEPDSVSAGLNDTVCINEGAFPLAGFFPAPPNGNWTGDGITDPINGIFDPAQAGAGLDTLIYCVGAGSCLVCDTTTILVEPIPAVTALPDSMCISDPAISLDDNGLAFGQVASGVWTGPFVNQVGANSYTFGPAPVGTYTLIFSYIDSINTQGCINADTTFVRVDSLPVASIAPLANACVGDNINFTNLSIDATSYLWDFGVTPIQTSNQFEPNFTYSDPGTFTVTLIAISAVGCADTTSQTIFISEPPLPQFNSNVDTACAMPTPIMGLIGVGADFTDLSNPAGGTYFWDFGGGIDIAGNTSSTDPNVPTIYFAQGTDDTTYTVSLTISNYCDTVTFNRTITVQPLPQVLFGPNQSTGCSPFCVDFNNASLGNATTFAWYADGVLFSNDSIPPQQCYFYQGIGDTTYTIRLIAQNACGADTAEHIITVLPNDVDAFFNIDQTQGCAPFTVTVTNLSGAPFSAFTFGDNSGSPISQDTVSHTYFQPGTYWLEHYANNNCSADTDSVMITVFAFPDVGVNPTDTSLCIDALATWADTTSPANKAAYQWSMGNGDTLSMISPTYAYDSAGTYEVILAVSSTITGCTARDTASVTVTPDPPAIFTASVMSGCAPLSIAFANGSPTGLTFNWDFGDGNFSNVANPTHVYTQAGTYTVTLTSFDNLACDGDSSITLVVHPQPTSAFTYVLDDSCGAPATASFTNLSSGSPIAYHWDFDTGNAADTSNLTTPSFSYNQPGIYNVSLISQTAFGCQDTAFDVLTVYPQPIAQIGVDSLRGCVPFNVNFNDLSQFNNNRRWLVDGNLITAANFSYTFQVPDTAYWVVLEVDTGGVCFDIDSILVETASNPLSLWRFDPAFSCGAPSLLSFRDSSQASLPLTYEWQFADGSAPSVLQSPTHVFAATGNYPVTQIVTNSFGCQDSLTQIVPIYPQAQADFEAQPDRGCAPLTVQFSNQSSAYSNVQWDFGDGSIGSTIDNPTHIFPFPDSSFVVQMIVDTAGVCADTMSVTIETGSNPKADFIIQPYDSCGPTRVQFTDASFTTNPPLAYFWDFGNGSNSTQQSPEGIYAQAGNYEVQLKVTNDFGCEDSFSKSLTIFPAVNAMFDLSETLICVGQSIQFSNQSTGANTYLWLIGNQTFSEANPFVAFPEEGLYPVRLIVSYDDKCIDTLDYPVPIEVIPNPVADFVIQDTIAIPAIEEDGTLQFLNRSSFANRYEWNFGGLGMSGEINPIYRFPVNGGYTVDLIAYNELGCSDTFSRDTSITGYGDLIIPNAFAPLSGTANQDFTRFLPKGHGITAIDLRVYNVWGQVVWQMDSSAIDPATGSPRADFRGWDGMINEKLAPGDVFYWKLHKICFGEGNCDDYEERRGTVTLIR